MQGLSNQKAVYWWITRTAYSTVSTAYMDEYERAIKQLKYWLEARKDERISKKFCHSHLRA